MNINDLVNKIEKQINVKVLAVFEKGNENIFAIAPDSKSFPAYIAINVKTKSYRMCNIIDEFSSGKQRDNAMIYPKTIKHSDVEVTSDLGEIFVENFFMDM